MNVRTLIAALRTVDPEAEVRLWGRRGPDSQCPPGEVEGAVIYVAISQVDGTDTLVILANSVDDKRGNPVFDAPPQIKRFKVNTKDGLAAAAGDLYEQAGCEATSDLQDELEKEKLRQIFRSFEDLLNNSKED